MKAAEQGNAYAQLNLADMYYQGEGTTIDYEEAFKWFMKAGASDLGRANYCLGNMNLREEGKEQNYGEAV